MSEQPILKLPRLDPTDAQVDAAIVPLLMGTEIPNGAMPWLRTIYRAGYRDGKAKR